MEIESRFGVKVTDEVKGKINTLGELAEYVESHRS
jgi:acyl carrier protein